MTEYETIEGTQPHAYVEHEPRVVTRKDDDLMMMTEIGDGVFVQWGNCRKCSERVATCKCQGGPVEPPHMKTWRDERFLRELGQRPDPDFDLLPSVLKWVEERGHRFAKTGDTASLMKAAQEAQDAIYGDSNDSEIDLLRDALEQALGLLGLKLPEGKNPDDEDVDERDPVFGLTDAEADVLPDDTETGDKIDEGLDVALEKVKDQKEDPEDVGF